MCLLCKGSLKVAKNEVLKLCAGTMGHQGSYFSEIYYRFIRMKTTSSINILNKNEECKLVGKRSHFRSSESRLTLCQAYETEALLKY